MGLGSHEDRHRKVKKVVLFVDQGKRDRSRYRVVQAVNSVAFPMGRKLTQEDLRRIMDSGVEVVVKLRKEG